MNNNAYDSRAYCLHCLGWALAYEGMDRGYANSLVAIEEARRPCRRCLHEAVWCEAGAEASRTREAA